MVALAFWALTVGGCNEPASPTAGAGAARAAVEPCGGEPLDPFVAFEVGGGEATSRSFSGQVVEIGAPDPFAGTRYRVREATGKEHVLVCRMPGRALPLVTGRTYDFALDYVGGTPSASGLVVTDQDGLLFAGASDQGVGDHVLGAGVPGFALRLLPITCPSRGQGECYDAVFNRGLEVTSGDRKATLYQGDAARVAGHDVRCLIAQQVTYSSRCADYALHAVSYTITRAP